jgi:hypothetical protein
MAVKIDLELRAADVESEILAIAGAMETLDEATDGLDLDLDVDNDKITGQIGDIIDELNDLESNLDLSGLDQKITRLENLDDIQVNVSQGTPTGDTNDGDSTGDDPPEATLGSGFDKVAKGIAQQEEQEGKEPSLADISFMPGSFGDDPTAEDGGFDVNEFKSDLSKFVGIDERKLNIANKIETEDLERIASDLQDGVLNPLGEPNDDLENAPWNELQQVASDFDVHEGSQNREELIDRIRAERTGISEAIRVDTDEVGTVGLGRALQEQQAPDDYDIGFESEFRKQFADMIDESDLISESLPELEQQRRDLLESAGIDSEKMQDFDGFSLDKIDPADRNLILEKAGIDESDRFDTVGRQKDSLDQFTADQQRRIRGATKEVLPQTDLTSGRSRETFADLNADAIKEEGMSVPEIELASGRQDREASHTNRNMLARFTDTNLGKRIDNIESLGDAHGFFSKSQNKLGKRLKRLRPTMGKYMQLLAAMIPIAVGLGTQLLGVAAAMGAVGAAGAAMLGIGLLGHADSLQGSLAAAKRQMRGLKIEMFEEVQPLAQQFAPIQSRMFDAIPDGMGGIFEEMEGLTAFEDTIFQAGGNIAGGIEELFAIINRNQGIISELTTEFGGIIGSGLLQFFEWLLQEAASNTKMIKNLSGGLIKLAVVAYNVSLAISRIIATMRPFFSWLAGVSNLLNNRFILGLLTFLTIGGAIAFTVMKIGTAFLWLGGIIQSVINFFAVFGSGGILAGMISFFKVVSGLILTLIGELTALQTAALAAASALALTGIGALVVGGGLVAGGAAMSAMKGMEPDTDAPSRTGRSTGGKTVYQDNRNITITNEGEMDYATQKGVEDTVKEVNEDQQMKSIPDTAMDTVESIIGGGNN